jgi:hypothetical protein
VPRITTAVVSKYQRSRIHSSQFVRGEFTTFGANFNGVLDEDVTIDSVTWFTATPWAIIMSNPAISNDRKSVTVDVLIGYGGPGNLKCVATLSDGKIRNQLYGVSIIDSPWVDGEAEPSQGSSSVTYDIPPFTAEIDPPGAVVSDTTQTGEQSAGTFTAVISGGATPYAYLWAITLPSAEGVFTLSGATSSACEVLYDTDNPPGAYTVDLDLTVTDALGETATAPTTGVDLTLSNA